MLGFLGIGARTSKSVSTFASGPRSKVKRGLGGSRHDPGRIRYGCFLPDLTGLARAPSAPSPEADIGRIWPECESPLRHALRACHLPRLAGEERRSARIR